MFRAAAGAVEVAGGFFVHAEEAHGRTVFRRHVGNRRAVDHGQRLRARSVKFDELSDDLGLAEHLRHVEHEVGRGDPFLECAGQIDADHFRGEEIDRLAEHAGFGLNAADAPANHAETIDHRRVRIRPDEGVRVINAVLLEHAFGEIFEIHLVDDPDPRRHHTERLEGLLAPFEQLVTLPVALEFEFEIELERLGRAKEIDLHGVVDDQVHRHEGLDHFRIAAEARNRRAHRREIDEQGHPGEVLQDHTRHNERNFHLRRLLRVPVGQRLDVLLGNLFPVTIPEHGLQNDADADGEAGDRPHPLFFQSGQRVEAALFP